MNVARYFFLVILSNLLFVQTAVAQTENAPTASQYKDASEISVADFFKRVQYLQMILSPDDRKLGTLAPINGLDNLAVIDLDKRKSAVITTFSSEDVSQFS